MSLLMEALKQQQGQQPPAPPQAYIAQPPAQNQGWKILALLLLVLVGLLAGFLLAQYLQKPAEAPVVAVQPASTGQILTDLLAVPATTQADAVSAAELSAGELSAGENSAEPQLLISAQPRQGRKAQQQTLDEQVALVAAEHSDAGQYASASEFSDEFNEQPAMAEADLADDVATIMPQQPELSASEVSDELKSKFALALEETGSAPRRKSVTDHAAPARDINSLDELLKRQIPPLRFEAHVYATEPKQRWVKVNGKDLQEGQWVTADIQIKEITPQYVLLQTGRQLFSVEALSEWSYRLPGR